MKGTKLFLHDQGDFCFLLPPPPNPLKKQKEEEYHPSRNKSYHDANENCIFVVAVYTMSAVDQKQAVEYLFFFFCHFVVLFVFVVPFFFFFFRYSVFFFFFLLELWVFDQFHFFRLTEGRELRNEAQHR